jgi:hypothetical protein
MLLWFSTISWPLKLAESSPHDLSRISLGHSNAAVESRLMVTEKISAALEAAAILARGGDASHIIDNYRKHVAANASRLRR